MNNNIVIINNPNIFNIKQSIILISLGTFDKKKKYIFN